MEFTRYLDAVKWCNQNGIDIMRIEKLSFYKWKAPKRK